MLIVLVVTFSIFIISLLFLFLLLCDISYISIIWNLFVYYFHYNVVELMD